MTNYESQKVGENNAEIEDMLDEYENRLSVLADEISELKQTILSNRHTRWM